MKTKEKKNTKFMKMNGIHFQVGLIISLALVLMAFEYKVPVKKIELFVSPTDLKIDEEFAEITKHEKRIDKPLPKVVTVIEEVKDDVETEEVEIISAEVTDETENDLSPADTFEDEEEVEEMEPFMVVEEQPTFKGGMEGLVSFLKANIEYPETAKEAGIEGKVFISFVVEKSGKITKAVVVRGIGGGCDEEALRVVNSMPDWNPGKQRSMPVPVHMNLPITFNLH
jgi:protein TonB